MSIKNVKIGSARNNLQKRDMKPTKNAVALPLRFLGLLR